MKTSDAKPNLTKIESSVPKTTSAFDRNPDASKVFEVRKLFLVVGASDRVRLARLELFRRTEKNSNRDTNSIQLYGMQFSLMGKRSWLPTAWA